MAEEHPHTEHHQDEKADYLNVYAGLVGTLIAVGLVVAAAHFLAQALHH